MKNILKNNYIILLPILILNIISLFYLYNTPYFTKQLIYIIISYFILFIFSKINYKVILKYSRYFYFICLFLLILVLFIGREINGSKAWIKIYNISIQPSELTKFSMIIYFLSLIPHKINIYKLLILTIIPTILTYLEPDTGAIIFYIIIFLSFLKYTNINKKTIITFLTLITIIITSHIIIYFVNKDLLINIYGPNLFYRLDRLITFKNQDNIQNIYSLISIGSHHLLNIPENHNDFIFASLISKYSLFIFLITLISYIIIFIYYITKLNKKTNISNILNFSILNMLLFQVFYNILMNLSLVPIIGIPLPFISYGGSYLITLYPLIGLSINLNILNNNKVLDMV